MTCLYALPFYLVKFAIHGCGGRLDGSPDSFKVAFGGDGPDGAPGFSRGKGAGKWLTGKGIKNSWFFGEDL
jgi:hypothetical protein